MWVQRASTARELPIAARFVQDYESSTAIAEEQAHLDTCMLQAIQLRAAHNMQLLEYLVRAAEEISKSGKAPAKKTAKNRTGSRSNAPKGRKAVTNKAKKKN